MDGYLKEALKPDRTEISDGPPPPDKGFDWKTALMIGSFILAFVLAILSEFSPIFAVTSFIFVIVGIIFKFLS